MGIYLNPDNRDFKKSRNSRLYVDKSMLIDYLNQVMDTDQQFVSVSRPRRFGKSMAANMISAYYSRGCDSRKVFSGLKIADSVDFTKNLNQYNVIHLNMQDLLTEAGSVEEMLKLLQSYILFELTEEFPDVRYFDRTKLVRSLKDVYTKTKVPFVFVIDEWDCVFRIHQKDTKAQKQYLDYLRFLLKDQSYVSLAYMTGILPIKKYGEHSALNMFYEYSMMNASPIEEFTGFTEEEVQELCKEYPMPFDEMKKWYDGYHVNGLSVYNPKSVVEAIFRKNLSNYWTQTETYGALKIYIQMNQDGLHEKVSELVAGGDVPVNTAKFQNDMTTFQSADDVLTLMIHLGYLSFDGKDGVGTCHIPNSEVQQEFMNCVEEGGYEHLIEAVRESEELLALTWQENEEEVAKRVEKIHQENSSILQYNNELSLSCAVTLAYYAAKKQYTIVREMPAGKGFADLVFIPDRESAVPAMVVELKWNESAQTALDQIRDQNYPDCLERYHGEILLVGISYDKDEKIQKKKHFCKIERVEKN
ncbi:MAG: ATP-binding protein [Lachnospiraceae bacterium]|nr:ATP-binding protein [Lachnospiraceae bacterium]